MTRTLDVTYASVSIVAHRDDPVNGKVAGALRRTFGLHAQEVAEEAGLTRAAVASFESGNDHRRSTAEKITAALSKLIEQRIGESPAPLRDIVSVLQRANETERRLLHQAIVWMLTDSDDDRDAGR